MCQAGAKLAASCDQDGPWYRQDGHVGLSSGGHGGIWGTFSEHFGRCIGYGHVYFVPIGPKIAKKWEKQRSTKSLLNLHFKGFGVITRSDSNRALKTVHFGIGEVPKCPTDDRFMEIWAFLAIFHGWRAPFFCQKWQFLAWNHFPPTGLLPQAPFSMY